MNEAVRIVVVFDNEQYVEGFQTGWGFSAVVETAGKKIMFDTGPDASKLLSNMGRLGIEPGRIDIVVLSHIHPDHTGGLEGFLKTRAGVDVYVPAGFPDEFKQGIKKCGAKIIEVSDGLQICENVYSTGQIGGSIKEQGLVVKTDKGAILIVGCAHPGVVKMAEAAKRVAGERILLLMGGFHLEWTIGLKIKWIISELKKLGVRYVAPSHCTGERAKRLLDKGFSDFCISMGTGKVIEPGALV
jgi:7,8-dihydropterin-6-yl-methyl-4-(beta-D-ribofuranosyl)aminobenzene 5'-phosphate synthase